MGEQASKEYHAAYRAANIEKRREWNREWIATNRDRYNAQKGIYREKLKRKVLAHYSKGDVAECSVCGCQDVDCLVIDHVNNDGADHRKELNISGRGAGGGNRTYEALHSRGLPDGVELQVLCANCNLKKQVELLRAKRLRNPYFADRYRREVIEGVDGHNPPA